jgi:hypothetical protein
MNRKVGLTVLFLYFYVVIANSFFRNPEVHREARIFLLSQKIGKHLWPKGFLMHD